MNLEELSHFELLKLFEGVIRTDDKPYIDEIREEIFSRMDTEVEPIILDMEVG